MYKRFGIFITVSRVDPFEYSFSDYIVSTIIQYGEGNGHPLQYSCLENPMDGGAW